MHKIKKENIWHKQFCIRHTGVAISKQIKYLTLVSPFEFHLQLPEPLLTYELYNDFIEIAKEFPGEIDKADEERLHERLKDVIDKLPLENWKVTSILMHHLKR